MATRPSRRSFLVDTLNKSAGLWLTLTGGAALATAPGCSSNTGATGTGPVTDATDDVGLTDATQPEDVATGTDATQDVQDAQPDAQEDLGPVAKYGGPPDTGVDIWDDVDTYDSGPAVKYGGPPQDVG